MRTRTNRIALTSTLILAAAGGFLAAAPLGAQATRPEPIEVPLRVEDGRLLVTAEAADGSRYDFVLGLGMPLLTQSGAAALEAAGGSLTLGGQDVLLDGAQTVPDAYLPGEGPTPVGVLGSPTLNRFDLLIDAPNGRLLLKPVGRSVRWDGIALSGSVPVTVFHDILIRADVQVGGEVYGGLLDLSQPALHVNEPLRASVAGGRTHSFRMGYAGWPDLPVEVSDSPVFGRWVGEGEGFVILGAAVAWNCVLAISFRHSEIRTCLR